VRTDRRDPPPVPGAVAAPTAANETAAREVSAGGLDAVLARVPVSAERWAEALPPAPADAVVTMSFSSPAVLADHAEALQLLGYRVLDAPSLPSEERVAWMLVGRDVIENRRPWWEAVRCHADRVYDLRFGPALRLLDAIVAAHLTTADGPG
jgi:hypothetical protein